MTTGDDVRIEVLGQIQVTDGDAVVSLSPQTRRLIGVLVAASGEPVSADRIAEYVADGRVEGSTVRTAVSRARKVLGDRLSSCEGGYRLSLADDELDAARFDALVGRSRSAPEEVRAGVLASALELWRGRAFGELAEEEWATPTAARLDLARATATEDLASTMLDGGRSADVVEILEPHVAEHPYRERPVGLLMRALDAAGRRADAVRAYQRFRTTLRDDTGLDPSSELRDLEAELLADDPAPAAGAPQLPSGTVTFLFTDIEGSTERWADDEQAMGAALAAHDAIIRGAVDEHGGVVFKHTGDGMCAAFSSAPEAVAAAVDAQERLGLPVRMGLHTGEAELRDGDYFGPTLNRVARIMDAGHGGQILMSSPTAGLVPAVERSELGEHRLKGLSSPERIVQVGAQEFSALRVATSHKGNLPVDATGFVGRFGELNDVVERVTEHRCVTLLGVGGTGKTRLATEVGHRLAPAFPDGCWMAELSRVVVPEAVPHAVCAGVGLEIPERADVAEYVVSRLRHQRLLVVIDNCEHVLEAAADIVEAILASCPTVTVVATSREPLMVAGEHLVPTPSLTPEDAVELFVDRVGAEAPSMVLDERQMDSVRAICERLDRLPLAIELAASRARSMSPIEIEARLDERFRLLVGGRRSRMERHQTMRGTVDWSYELCSELEREVFCRLSVFAGEFDLDDALGVAAVDDDRWDVEDALARLVDRSLVQRIPAPDGTTRYRLLETMRAYGHERLVAHGTADVTRLRHVEHIADTVAALSLRAVGPDEEVVRSRLRAYVADLLLAVDWCLERREWQYLPKLCAYALGWSTPGVAMSMWERVGSAIPPIDEPMDGVPPLLHLGLITHGVMTANGITDDMMDAFIDLVESGETIPHDALHLNPLVDVHHGYARPDRAAAAMRTFLEGLRTAPLPIRWYHAMVSHYTFSLLDPSFAAQSYDALVALTEQLDSEWCSRSCSAQGALLFEVQGDLSKAEDLARQALGSTISGWGDVLTACRWLRIIAKAHGTVTGADLRRPIDWEMETAGGRMRDTPLASIAVALDASGRRLLALRIIAAMEPRLRMPYAHVFRGNAPAELVEAFASDAPPVEDLDDVTAAVYELADEVDRLEELA